MIRLTSPWIVCAAFTAAFLGGSAAFAAEELLFTPLPGAACQADPAAASPAVPAVPGVGLPETLEVIVWPDCAVSCGNPQCSGVPDGTFCSANGAPGFCHAVNNNTCGGEFRRSRCECVPAS